MKFISGKIFGTGKFPFVCAFNSTENLQFKRISLAGWLLIRASRAENWNGSWEIGSIEVSWLNWNWDRRQGQQKGIIKICINILCTRSARKFLFIKQIFERKSVLRMSRRKLKSAFWDRAGRSLLLPSSNRQAFDLMGWLCWLHLRAFQTGPLESNDFEIKLRESRRWENVFWWCLAWIKIQHAWSKDNGAWWRHSCPSNLFTPNFYHHGFFVVTLFGVRLWVKLAWLAPSVNHKESA